MVGVSYFVFYPSRRAPRAIIGGMKLAFLLCVSSLAGLAADLRIGIVGTDTSHAPAFTGMLNDPSNKYYTPGARVVAAYKGGSADLESSITRVDKYAQELSSKYGVEIVTSIPELLEKVDAILLESVDGRKHLPQFKEIMKAGKPIFIDKPLASTYADAVEIARLARENKVRWFSASSLRFSTGIPALKQPGIRGAVVWGPGPTDKTHQLDLSWYGIHAVETLYTFLGRGCVEVTRVSGPNGDTVVGKWGDGRLGTVVLDSEYAGFGATTFTNRKSLVSGADFYTGYQDLVKEILKFFQGGPAPVDVGETLEMFAFMDAAQRSKEAGGKAVPLK